MAFNNPELLIENYLYNNAFDDAEEWKVVGEFFYEAFPYLTILLLFDNKDKVTRSAFVEKFENQINRECIKYEEMSNMISPLYKKKKEEYTETVQNLENHIAELEDIINCKDRRSDEQALIFAKTIKERDLKYENLKKEYEKLKEMYDYLNSNKKYFVTLSDDILRNIVVRYFKTEHVYNVSRLTADTYDFNGLIGCINKLTGFFIEKKNIEGKKIGSSVTIIKEQLELLQGTVEKEMVTEYTKPLDIKTFDHELLRSIIHGCCKKKNYEPRDVFSNVKIDFPTLIKIFKEEYGVELDLKEIEKQSRMDNLENFLWVHLCLSDISEIVKSAAVKIAERMKVFGFK